MRQARRIPANVRVLSAKDAVLLSVRVLKPEVNPIDKLVRDCGRGVYDGERCQVRTSITIVVSCTCSLSYSMGKRYS